MVDLKLLKVVKVPHGFDVTLHLYADELDFGEKGVSEGIPVSVRVEHLPIAEAVVEAHRRVGRMGLELAQRFSHHPAPVPEDEA